MKEINAILDQSMIKASTSGEKIGNSMKTLWAKYTKDKTRLETVTVEISLIPRHISDWILKRTKYRKLYASVR